MSWDICFTICTQRHISFSSILTNQSIALNIFYETLKYWVSAQRGQSYLRGEAVYLAMVGHPSSDVVTIKIPYGVDVLLYRSVSHPIFYWVS